MSQNSHIRRTLLFVAGLALGWASASHAAEGQPIKVGASIPLTGEFESFGNEQARGLRFWVRDINGRGSLLGRPVELVVYDDESKTEGVAAIYERLISQDRVDVLVSPYSSPQTLEAAAVAERHGVPMVSVAAANTIWERGFKNVFGVFTPARHNMDPVFSVAAEHNLRSVAIAYQSSEFPESVAEGARRRAAENGMRVVFDQSYPESATNLNGLVSAMADTNPDVVIVGAYLEDSVAFIRAAKRQNFAPGILAFSGAPALAEFGQVVGSSANGVMSTVQWTRSDRLPGSFDFGFRFQARYGLYPSYHAAGGYGCGQILEAAVRLAGTTDHAAVREQLGTMVFRSILGHYRVDETGMQIGKPKYLIQWQGTHRSMIYPPEIARWDVRVPFPAWSGR